MHLSMFGRVVLALVLLVTPGFVTRAAVTLPYLSDFEPGEGYTEGPFSGVDPGWDITGSATVSSGGWQNSQSLLLGPGSPDPLLTLEVTPQAGEEIVFLDFQIRPIAMQSVDALPLSAPLDTSALTALVAFGESLAQFHALSGDGTGSGVWMAVGPDVAITSGQPDDWVRLTYRLDYAARRWDLYIGGVPVAFDLGFAGQPAAFTRFQLQGDSTGSVGFDAFTASTVNPLFVDADRDGIDDLYEVDAGMNPNLDDRSYDNDADGLQNAFEYLIGTSAGLADTDGDGLNDGLEWWLGDDPTSAGPLVLGSLPFSDDFEALTGPNLSGHGYWLVNGPGTAQLETNEVAEGAKALRMQGEVTVTHWFNGIGFAQVWTDFQMRSQPFAADADPMIDQVATVAFFLRNDGRIRVYDANQEIWIDSQVQVAAPNDWHRYTVLQNFAQQTWSLWVDGEQAADQLPFASPMPYYQRFELGQIGGTSYIDAVSASATAPPGILQDADEDGMLDQWETLYGLNPNDPSDAALDLDGDGWTNLEEFLADTSPQVSQRATLPYALDFEAQPEVADLQADGWFINGSGGQSVADAYAGAYAWHLQAGTEPVSMAHTFDPAGADVVWLDFALKPALYGASQVPSLDPITTAGFYFADDQTVRTYDGKTGQWTTQPLEVSPEGWRHVTLQLDYASQQWSLWIDGDQVAANLGFANARPAFDRFTLTATPESDAWLDELWIGTTSLPSAWRQQYFGSLNVDPAADPDGDGFDNFSEYQKGTDPTDYFSREDGPITGLALTILQGAGQSAAPGETLPFPLELQLTCAEGITLANAPVSFQLATGAGYFDGDPLQTSLATTTDAQARVSVTFTPTTFDLSQNLEITISSGTATTAILVDEAEPALSVTDLAAGAHFSLLVDGAGEVVAWGQNHRGQLGTADSLISEHRLTFANPIVTVAAGESHAVAIDENGTLHAWGDNRFGQCATAPAALSAPFQVSLPGPVSQVAAGHRHTVALLTDGRLFAWGANDAGQLGDGTRIDRSAPVEITSLTNITAITCGSDFTACVDQSGAVHVWGSNASGQIPGTAAVQSSTPVALSGLPTITAIVAGDRHLLALATDDVLWSWGDNRYGQTGQAPAPTVAPAALPAYLSPIATIEAGSHHSLVLLESGAVHSWGANWAGQLGNGTREGSLDTETLAAGSEVTVAAAGHAHTLLLTSTGEILGAGGNWLRQLHADPVDLELNMAPLSSLPLTQWPVVLPQPSALAMQARKPF